jgi:dTDP-4-dehydrorhamnose reductase
MIPLDLSRRIEDWPRLPDCRVAVLCAAITNLEACRRDPEGTRKVNVEHTLTLARHLADRGARVIFISTNLVFDGSKPLRPADDEFCPRTEYGRQKVEVETRLASEGMSHAIVRLTKVFHPGLPLLLDWLSSLRAGTSITPFADMVCAPIALGTVIQGIAAMAGRTLGGVWQFSPRTDISYAEAARQVARRVGADESLLNPSSAALLPAIEHVPRHTALDSTRAREELGLSFSEPEEVIASCLPT